MPPSENNLLSVRRWVLFFDVIKIVFVAVLIVALVRWFVAEPFIVSGDSMVPTFASNDYLVIDELTYAFHPPLRGDVIVFRYPLDPSIYFIKRLIGVPGDTVVVSNGSVFIQSGKLKQRVLDEPYIQTGKQKIETGTTTLGQDEYFVLGDNRNSSFDSRVWGPVPRRYIVGRAWVRLYPFTQTALYTRVPTGTSSATADILSTGR